MSKQNKKAVNWTIDKEIVEHFQKKANKQGRSLSSMINFALHMARKTKEFK